MRVGIPHRGGKLAFHAFECGYPAMVSANAFWNPRTASFRIPDATDLQELDFALDSAGFTAMSLWKAKGRQSGMAGIFPWTYEQYIEFANTIGATWWAQPDLCCEPEIAANQDEIDFRVDATATLLHGTLMILDRWRNELARTCSDEVVRNMLTPPTPVIQGWSVSDYRRSLDMMLEVWYAWFDDPPALIGIGSVCRRTLKHPTHGLFTIVNSIERHIPDGSMLHLFGVKGTALSRLRTFTSIASADSMAYDFLARVRARDHGISNSLAHRSSYMSHWMTSANGRIRPAENDQLRLHLKVPAAWIKQ